MVLENPDFLFLLIFIPILAVYSIVSHGDAVRWRYRIFGLAEGRRRFYAILLLRCSCIALLVFSLSTPSISRPATRLDRSAISVVIGLDISKSMLAEDISFSSDLSEAAAVFTIKNRLNGGRRFALNFLSRLRGERAGFFIFAAQGIEMVPPTEDHGFCRYVIRHIDDSDIAEPGSDLAAAMQTGISMLENVPEKNFRAVVLISDGEQTRPDTGDLKNAIEKAVEKQIPVFTTGVGSVAGGHIPIRNPSDGNLMGYFLDRSGQYLKTRLEPEPLEWISRKTGGRYYPLNEEDQTGKILSDILDQARQTGGTRKTDLVRTDLSPWFLGIALLVFITAWIFEKPGKRY